MFHRQSWFQRLPQPVYLSRGELKASISPTVLAFHSGPTVGPGSLVSRTSGDIGRMKLRKSRGSQGCCDSFTGLRFRLGGGIAARLSCGKKSSNRQDSSVRASMSSKRSTSEGCLASGILITVCIFACKSESNLSLPPLEESNTSERPWRTCCGRMSDALTASPSLVSESMTAVAISNVLNS